MYDVPELDYNGDDKKDLSKQIHFLLCEICFFGALQIYLQQLCQLQNVLIVIIVNQFITRIPSFLEYRTIYGFIGRPLL